jgi:cullin-associated NEDD8-dissociated protein 1
VLRASTRLTVCVLLSQSCTHPPSSGNARQADDLQDVKCWNEKSSIVVKVGDSCPCQQKKPDGSVQPQFWCCGGANHMDMSYW